MNTKRYNQIKGKRVERFPQSWFDAECWIFWYSRNFGLNSVNIDPSKGWWSSDRSRKWDIVITLLPYSGGEGKDNDGDRGIGILKSANNHVSILIQCQIDYMTQSVLKCDQNQYFNWIVTARLVCPIHLGEMTLSGLVLYSQFPILDQPAIPTSGAVPTQGAVLFCCEWC